MFVSKTSWPVVVVGRSLKPPRLDTDIFPGFPRDSLGLRVRSESDPEEAEFISLLRKNLLKGILTSEHVEIWDQPLSEKSMAELSSGNKPQYGLDLRSSNGIEAGIVFSWRSCDAQAPDSEIQSRSQQSSLGLGESYSARERLGLLPRHLGNPAVQSLWLRLAHQMVMDDAILVVTYQARHSYWTRRTFHVIWNRRGAFYNQSSQGRMACPKGASLATLSR
jgi:hypothetical protein